MYLFPELTTQLQFLCSPREYNGLPEPKVNREIPEFWAMMPTYRYAQCPFCGREYREKANTYTLSHWGSNILSLTLYSAGLTQENEKAKHCNHFLGIRKFINLYGIQPMEREYFSNKAGEVPFVDSHFFHDDMRSYVILHALPICRIENGTFVPTYTVFLMTYFTEDPQGNMRRNYQAQQGGFDNDIEFWPSQVTSPYAASPVSLDLAEWAEHGKLGWLDYMQPNLPLRLGKGEILPDIYRNIQGQREPYIWRRPK